MLSESVFKEGINEIKEVFPELELKPKTLKIWYKYSKYLTDKDFLYRVKNCIKGCRKIPTLADILDWKNYYVNGKEEADLKARQDRIKYEKQKREEEPIKERTEETKMETYEILKEVIPECVEKLKKLKDNKRGSF